MIILSSGCQGLDRDSATAQAPPMLRQKDRNSDAYLTDKYQIPTCRTLPGHILYSMYTVSLSVGLVRQCPRSRSGRRGLVR